MHNSSTSVIIINWNSGTLLRRCLQALSKQTLAPAEVIVVDNASTKDSISGFDKEFPWVQFIYLKENLGFAAGNNLAVGRMQKNPWLALLNPDAFPEPNWLLNLHLAVKNYPLFSVFGSHMVKGNEQQLIDGTGDIYHISGDAWRRDVGKPATAVKRSTGEIFAPCAAAAIYPTEAFLEVGGFDEDYFCYFEDVDLGFRLQLAGYRSLYVQDAIVHHIGSAITGKQSDFAVYHGQRNLVWTYLKNMPSYLFWLYLPLHIILNLFIPIFLSRRKQGMVALRAKRDALKDLFIIIGKRRHLQKKYKPDIKHLRRIMTGGIPRWDR